MSRLPIKTLRFYHEKGVLTPARVEAETGYRYYSRANLDQADVIRALRDLDFSLETVREILASHDDDADLLDYLEARKVELRAEMERREEIVRVLDLILDKERETRTMLNAQADQVVTKTLPPVIVAGLRMKGRYADCGKAFGKIGRKVGRHIAGKAMMLCYDQEYREDDADFEPCMPLKRLIEAEGLNVRELEGGPHLSLIHHGPYDDVSRTYSRLLEHAKENGIQLKSPSREVYIKGPGMIFKGNPKKYITEIQFPIDG